MNSTLLKYHLFYNNHAPCLKFSSKNLSTEVNGHINVTNLRSKEMSQTLIYFIRKIYGIAAITREQNFDTYVPMSKI